MKSLYPIYPFLILISFTQLVSGQHTKQHSNKNAKETTKNVILQATEMDYTIDEIEKFDAYVNKHLKAIPGANGEVVISFTNKKDGSITDVKVAKGLSKAADAEAVRLIKAYPKWQPNTIDGEPQRSTLNIQIPFGKK